MLPADDQPDTLPEPTEAAIRSLYAPPCPLPADQLRGLDDRILAQARTSLAARRRPSAWSFPQWGRGLALAAAATLTIAASAWFVSQGVRRAAPSPNQPLALRNGGPASGGAATTSPDRSAHDEARGGGGDERDLNHDGRVDILDALALAKAIDSKSPDLSRWSLTRGREVGQVEVDALASSVVQIQKKGGAS